MRSISVSEFKSLVSQVVDEVSSTGEPVLVSEKGQPFVVLSPILDLRANSFVPGQFRDTATIAGDVVIPFEEHWELLCG